MIPSYHKGDASYKHSVQLKSLVRECFSTFKIIIISKTARKNNENQTICHAGPIGCEY